VKVPLESVGCFEVKTAPDGAQAMEIINTFDAGIIVAHEPLSITKFVKPFTILKPKRIIVGVGARKAASKESIIKAIQDALVVVNLSLSRVDGAASVDIKKDSKPMVEAFLDLGLPVEFFSADNFVKCVCLTKVKEQVDDRTHLYSKSEWGWGRRSLLERAAVLVAGNNAKLISKKPNRTG
jgi:cobalt-precorrin 5A hydrolase